MITYLYRKYRGTTFARGVPPPEEPPRGRQVVVPGRLGRYVLGALATVVCGVPPAEALAAEIPVEHGTIVVPLGIPYRSHVWQNPLRTQPPEAESGIPVETGTVVVPLGAIYRGASIVVPPPPPELPTDEPFASRRSVTQPRVPYLGRSYTRFRQPTEIDELIPSRRAQFIPAQPYRGGKSFTGFLQPSESDQPFASRRSITQPRVPYLGKTVAQFRQPTEIDELLPDRRHIVVPRFVYSRGKALIVPPPGPAATLLEADELTNKRRAIYTPQFPYRKALYTQFRQPDELPAPQIPVETGSIVVPLGAIYRGQSIVVPPPPPDIITVVEAPELTVARRRIYTPVFPYAPNRVWTQLPPIAEPAPPLEAPELTIARMRALVRRIPYRTDLAFTVFHNLALDEFPPPQTVTGNARRALADQLIAPIGTPVYVRRLGAHQVIIFKDNDPWSRYFAEMSRNAIKPIWLTVTLDFPSTAPGSYNDAVVTIVGARIGDVAMVSVPPECVLPNITYFAFVSAENRVTIRCSNNHPLISQDPPAGEFRILLQRQ